MGTASAVDPYAAKRLIDQGAELVDIREPDERARTFIPGSRHFPLSSLATAEWRGGTSPVIFHCRSGGRTAANAARLAASTNRPAYHLSGGIDAWRSAGLPTMNDALQPIEVMRQVQIVTGLLVVTGVILGVMVAPGFYCLSALVGSGLVLAGVTGWCGMARLLGAMPWNRPASA